MRGPGDLAVRYYRRWGGEEEDEEEEEDRRKERRRNLEEIKQPHLKGWGTKENNLEPKSMK